MKVYICSPLRGDIERNIANAIEYCKLAAKQGHVPVCPQIYFTRFLDDNIPAERLIGMEQGLKLLGHCDELWQFGEPSEGMRVEIELAERLGIRVVKCLN